MRKRLHVFEQDSEILQMMASYRSHPVKELVTNAPWVIISVLLHVAFVVLAAYISWNVKVPQEAVILTPQIIKKLTPKTFVMKTIQPRKVKQDVNVEKQVQDDTKISQVNLPMLDDLMKKSTSNQDRRLLVRRGVNPVFADPLGGDDMRWGTKTSDATRDMVDWGEWTKGRILAVWLFDESLSMKDDQQEVKARVNEVYDKLELAAGIKGTSMKIVTTVASYGEKAHILIKEPTQDTEEVRKAIDRIPVDKSGDENYLGGINTVLDVFGPYAKKYKRRIVIILVTDEGGDDDDVTKLGAESPLEQTIARLKRGNSAVLVFGKMGGFYRAGTGERMPNGKAVTVNRGRDTGVYEFLKPQYPFTTYWFVHGGFGPYAYSRLAHETGGMLFLLNTMTDAYDYEKLLDGYQPEVVSRQEMLMRDRKNPLRRAIRECIVEWNDTLKKHPMPTWLRKEHAERNAKRGLIGGQKALDVCNKWIPRLEALGNTSAPDSPKRWEANRQFLIAQLYKRRYIAKGYLVAMRNMKEGRNIPLAGVNGWSISSYGRPPEEGSEAARDLAKVKAKYQYVVDRQDGTPWAEYARREVRYLGTVRLYPSGRGGKGSPRG